MFKGLMLSFLIAQASVPQIRVLIAKGYKIEVKGNIIEIVDPYTYKEMGLYSGSLNLYITSAGIVTGVKPTLKSYIIMRGKGIEIDGNKYPGRIEVIARDGKLYLINDLDLETYVKGVVASEVPSSWNVEALKAQAVAARTYAYNLIRKRRGELYDLSATVLHQVYSGIEHTDPKVILAVESTKGDVIFYQGRVIKPYYHSDCGGRTDSSESIWGTPLPYLQSVKCPFGGRKWKKEFNATHIGEKLGLSMVKSIKILKKTPAGRVLVVRISDGRRVRVVSGEEIRRMLGYRNIKSTIFKVRKVDRRFIFEGKGSGHGVGMCQWGAQKLAEMGHDYKWILKYYYKGVEIRKVY